MGNKIVIRSAATVGVFILSSRFFGMIRDMLMASTFGTSMGMSAFVAAFTIPNLFRALLGEGALSTAFIPVFTQTLEKDGRERVWFFVSRMLTVLILLLSVFVLLGIAIATLVRWMPLPERALEIARLSQIMMPYLLFICVSAFFSAILNALRKFALPAAAPVLLNLLMIAGLLWICPFLTSDTKGKLTVLSWLVVLGGVLQLAVQMPRLWQEGFRFGLSFDFAHPGVRQVGQLMAISAVGVGVTQINVLVDRYMAVFVGNAAPSYLYFAERLIYLPLGVFATSLSIVLLPTLSGFAARSDFEGIRQTVNESLRHLVFIMLPCAVFALAMAEPVIRLIYGRGEFSELSVAGTCLALQCYAPGLLLFALRKVFIPSFFALQDMKTPVRIGIRCAVLNIFLNAALIWPFGYAGIAFGTVIASFVESIWLARLLQGRVGSLAWADLAGRFGKIAVATALMAATSLVLHPVSLRTATTLLGSGFAPKAAAMAATMLAAGTAYMLAAILLRCAEAREIFRVLLKRRAKKDAAL